jgi:hypothetical protein
MGEIKKNSVKLVFLAFALTLLLTGLSAFKPGVVDYIQPTLILFGVAILGVEVGLKKLTSISSLKKFQMVNYISLGLIVIMGIYGIALLPFIPFSAPGFIVTLSNYLIFLLVGWIVVETLV